MTETGNHKISKAEAEPLGSSYISGDILQTYLRQIGDMPLLSPEEQHELSLQIITALKKYRTSLYRFGFIASEHIFILRNPSGSSATDYFMPSSLKKNGKPQFLSDALEWGDEIQKHYRALKNAFKKNSTTQKKIRRTLTESMMRYAVVYDYLEEWFKVALEYVRLAAPEFEPLKVSEADITEDQKILLEEKMLMKTGETLRTLHETAKARAKLHKLHQMMLEGNLRLVISVAQRYRSKGLPLPDLIQEGNMGLMRALEKFDFELGNRFSTYAIWWIKQNVTRAIASQSRVIRIPLHMITTIMAMNNAEQLFIQEHDREPSVEDLAKIMEVPTSRIGAIRKMARQAISLQAPLGSAEDSPTLEDVLSDFDSSDPTSEISRKILREKLYQILNLLPEREQQIMIMRFGLRGHQPMSLLELSKHFELTRERIRQIEIETFRRLRKADARNFLDNIIQYK